MRISARDRGGGGQCQTVVWGLCRMAPLGSAAASVSPPMKACPGCSPPNHPPPPRGPGACPLLRATMCSGFSFSRIIWGAPNAAFQGSALQSRRTPETGKRLCPCKRVGVGMLLGAVNGQCDREMGWGGMEMLPASLPRGRKHKQGAAKPFNAWFLPSREGQMCSRDHAGELTAVSGLAAIARYTCQGILGTIVPMQCSGAPNRRCNRGPTLLTNFDTWRSPPPAWQCRSNLIHFSWNCQPRPHRWEGREGWEGMAGGPAAPAARWEGGGRPSALIKGYAIDTWPLHGY